jgi:feruloyl esterase
MKRKNLVRTTIGLSIAGGVLAILGGCGGGGGGTPSTQTPIACEDLSAKFAMANVRITKTFVVAAAANLPGSVGASGPVVNPATGAGVANTGPVPEHCVVQGVADERVGVDNLPYSIGFEVRMPTIWNGRFYFQGGGGVNGFLATAFGDLRGNFLSASGIPTDNALNRGFAVATTDGGHRVDVTSADGNAQTVFGKDPQARLDYGYNAVARTTGIAKALINARFGTAATRSYFVGCSNGGRDAMVASQRLPNEFDGVYALNPGFQLPRAAVNQAWDTQQFSSLSPSVFDAFTQKDMNYASGRILAVCDALDGATDGIIQDRAACDTAIVSAIAADTLFATGAKDSGTGLTAAQKAALYAIFGGVKDASGNAFYADFPYDAGISFKDWRSWKMGTADPATSGAGSSGGLTPSQAVSIGAFSLPAVFMSPSTYITGDTSTSSPHALAFMRSVKTQLVLNGTVDPEAIYATSGIYTAPSMSNTARGAGFMPGNGISYDTFKNRGSKLIVAHGTSDGVFSPNDTKNWYVALNAAYGGNAATFARFFFIPGMNHCAGGAATDHFDMLAALQNWVENGAAPDSVAASSRDQNYLYTGAWAGYKPTLLTPGMVRPLCSYPNVARSSDGGATWACKP